MNKLTIQQRTAVVRAFVEGCSIRATARMTGVSKDTAMKLLVDMGKACHGFHDDRVRGLHTARVQCDEQWAFVGAKQKQVDHGAKAYGDAWLWVAMDSDTKLVISWIVGERGPDCAWQIMNDLAGRLNSRVQLTTDGFGSYLEAVRDNFGNMVDYGQLVKLYGDDPRLNRGTEARYSPGHVTGCKQYARIGTPDHKHISTSHIERQNLTMRMGNRRFTRLTNAFSKKIENHDASVSLHYGYYNWCRTHQTLRVTPAMQAGLTDHVWTIEELVGVLEAQERTAIEAGALKRGAYRPRNSN